MTATFPSGASYTENSTTYQMSNRKPDRGYAEERTFDMIPFESQAGYETRRLRSRRPKRRYTLNYTNLNGFYMNAIRDFYNARYGNFEAFFFNLEYLNQSGLVSVRFDGPLQVTNVLDGSINEKALQIYNVNFTLQEVFT